jgi:hypothetical protein
MHGQKVIQSNRYAVETKEGNFDLFITGIVEEDAGTYICQINSEPMQNIVSGNTLFQTCLNGWINAMFLGKLFFMKPMFDIFSFTSYDL